MTIFNEETTRTICKLTENIERMIKYDIDFCCQRFFKIYKNGNLIRIIECDCEFNELKMSQITTHEFNLAIAKDAVIEAHVFPQERYAWLKDPEYVRTEIQLKYGLFN